MKAFSFLLQLTGAVAIAVIGTGALPTTLDSQLIYEAEQWRAERRGEDELLDFGRRDHGPRHHFGRVEHGGPDYYLGMGDSVSRHRTGSLGIIIITGIPYLGKKNRMVVLLLINYCSHGMHPLQLQRCK